MCIRDRFFERFNPVGRKFNFVEPLLGVCKIGKHILHACAVFALELMDRVEPFFDFFELPFRVAQIVAHGAQLVRRILDTVHEGRNLLRKRLHVGPDGIDSGKRMRGIG